MRAADFGTALEPSVGSFRRHVVLNGLRIPLSEFAGVDLSRWRRSSCASARPRRAARSSSPTSPSRSGPRRAAPKPAAAVAPLAGPKRVDAIAVDGVTTVPSERVCADTTAPRTSLASLRVAGGRLVASGTARDAGCAAAGGLKARDGKLARVQVTVSRLTAGGCQYLRATGRLTAAKPCSAPLALIAKGGHAGACSRRRSCRRAATPCACRRSTPAATSSARRRGPCAPPEPSPARPAAPGAAGRRCYAVIFRIFSSRVPRGVSKLATLPTFLPTRALPIGESIESLPTVGSASWAEVSV